tara:strand:- start:2791 stop:3645 length:855 start_codon:yes stop_codon:yes gene_type:complete
MLDLKINKVADHIVEWIKDYSDKNNIDTLIVGVSGGIDSSVVSTLCAMTGKKTIIVEMPIRTNENYISVDKSIGRKHVEFLTDRFDNIQAEYVDLTISFKTMKSTLNSYTDQIGTGNFELSLANMASRLRMLTLYSFSNTYGGLVVGTGNKVEDYGIGFFTVGGDGQVDISPIADLMKSEVYQLGKHLGVIDEILNSKPTDGLWDDGRTDEDQIGASYDELEWAMEAVGVGFGIREDLDKDLTKRQREVLKIYLNRHNKNKFKMESIPTCIIPSYCKEEERVLE